MTEIGFGKAGQTRAGQRLLNRDGSFNVEKHGLGFGEQLSVYHSLMVMSWPRFIATLVAVYLTSNLIFASLYFLAGPLALEGLEIHSTLDLALECFFFSVQTFATIGYGIIHPITISANILVTIESLVGSLEVALLTGILFARFSRPHARLRFSAQALVSPYQGKPSLQFRMTNIRKSEIFEPEVQIIFSYLDGSPGQEHRDYDRLELLFSKVAFMPLYWTVTHVIDEKSPLHGMTHDDIKRCEGEFLILFSGTDELFSETVYVRHSYRADELVFDAKFAGLYVKSESGRPAIDVRLLSTFDRVIG